MVETLLCGVSPGMDEGWIIPELPDLYSVPCQAVLFQAAAVEALPVRWLNRGRAIHGGCCWEQWKPRHPSDVQAMWGARLGYLRACETECCEACRGGGTACDLCTVPELETDQ